MQSQSEPYASGLTTASGYSERMPDFSLAVFADTLAVFALAVIWSLHIPKISERKISERMQSESAASGYITLSPSLAVSHVMYTVSPSLLLPLYGIALCGLSRRLMV